MRFGTSVTGLQRERTGRVAGITARAGAAHLEVSADLVVGADGRRSTVARYVGAGAAHVAAASSAVIYRHDEPAQPRRLAAVNPAIPADSLPLTRRHPVQQNTPICVLCAGSDNTREAAQIGCDGLGRLWCENGRSWMPVFICR